MTKRLYDVESYVPVSEIKSGQGEESSFTTQNFRARGNSQSSVTKHDNCKGEGLVLRHKSNATCMVPCTIGDSGMGSTQEFSTRDANGDSTVLTQTETQARICPPETRTGGFDSK